MNYTLLKSLYYQSPTEYENAYLSRFDNPLAVHFDFDIHGKPAFALITRETALLMQKIYTKCNEIFNMVPALPKKSIGQFANHLLVEELRLSNEIEGVHSTRKELTEALAEVRENKKAKRFSGLVKKYSMLTNKEEIPLNTCEDIRALYNDLVLEEVLRDDKGNAPDGLFFRKEGVDVTSETQKVIHKGLSPEVNIIKAMTKLLNMLNDESIPLLIKIPVFHYYFGYIHPFYDGNGRMNRFITSYIISKELSLLPAINLSYVIKKDKSRYYKPFDYTNDPKNCGELTGYIIAFLEILEETEEEVISSLTYRLNKYNFFMTKLDAFNKLQHNVILQILLESTLFGSSGLTISELTQKTGLSDGTVRTALKKLIDDTGIIRVEKISNAFIYDLDLDKLSSI